ncbi:glycoside hydrolase family 3 N-terminal domain-containing protein [Alloiococcus sp. CFN-8]|uniref:glycoside hydrolase family 3 protein n=1 Tax=Alloiococcus sp. CFN-8 TaxID=3416081 RepID=UPI003CEACA2A
MVNKLTALFLTALLSVSKSAYKEAEDVRKIIDSMTLEQKITQMLMPDFRQWKGSGDASEKDMTLLDSEVADIIDDYDLGGVILLDNNVKETDQTLKLTYDMQKAAMDNKANNGSIPLFIAIDQESWTGYPLEDITALPGNMALGATGSIEYADETGRVIGSELFALGFNVNLAPVLDINNNPLNPVMGPRSYSSSADLVADLGVEQMNGMQIHNVSAAVKHFPGHGDTAVDSHTGLLVVDKSYEELASLELIPFQAAVDNGVDMVMTAHIAYPQIEGDKVISKKDGTEIYIPATLSHEIITGILRNKINYNGIVVTDALNMSAISENFGEAEAIIMAIEADVDILLMPTILRSQEDVKKLDNIISEVKNAVKNGRITLEDIDASLERILLLKERRGILDLSEDKRTFEERLTEAKAIVGSPRNKNVERVVAEEAVTVVKNQGGILPMKPEDDEKILLLTTSNSEARAMKEGMDRLIIEGMLPRAITYETYVYNSQTTAQELKQKIDGSDYVVVISKINSASQLSPYNWRSRIPTEVAAYGNSEDIPTVIMSAEKPYDAANYPEARAIAVVYGSNGMDPTEGIESQKKVAPNIPAGIEVIFGGRNPSGKLPVDIPVIENGVMDTSRTAYPIGHGLSYE